MKQPIKFIYGQEFATGSGGVITMKSLITIHGVQYVEAMEDNSRYLATGLTPIKQIVI